LSIRALTLACLLALPAFAQEEEKPEPAPAPAEGKAVTTPSGLKVELLKAGTPDTKPKPGEKVRVHYTGWLTDGTKFDSSVDRGEPFEFTLGRGMVIKGWDEGIALMDEGSKVRLTIPAELAYGARAMGKIPANSTLVFEVELLGVIRPPAFTAPTPEKQTTCESGLKYEVLKEGQGEAPRAEQGVKLSFAVFSPKGDLIISTALDNVHIAGCANGLQLTKLGEKFLDEAVRLMKPGGRYLFEVPADLCWGDKQVVPQLPAGSPTIWELELLSVIDLPAFEQPDPEKMTKTESGLSYQMLTEGTGRMPTAQDKVTVHYCGWLADGTVFDSSYARGEPATFPLGRVIPGWTEGMQLMKEGGKCRFVIPANLAYGPRQTGKIPANATLIFVVELLKVG